MKERFTYDHLNRLTDIWLNDVHTGHMAYDALGRMTDKRTDGQQVFSSAQHDYVGPDGQLRPHAVSSAQTGDGFPQAGIQSIDYTMFDKVSTMTYNGSNHYVFEYGYDHQRTRMTATNGGILMVNKDYVGSCEFVRHAASPQLSFTYLSGPMGVFAMVEKEGATEQVQYILKDHLGSYTAITDDDGELVLQQSFDAWGNRRNPSTWTGNAAALNFHDRGFTGHEHLFGMVGGIYKEIGLINMNGRMYDPVMSSFLSVDNYVQSPENSQNFNRYAYCLNNPLKYTDPSGEVFGIDDAIIIAGVAIGAYVGGSIANNTYNPVNWEWGSCKTWGYMIGGALTGLASAGAGIAVAGTGCVFCNTFGIMASSAVNSLGQLIYTSGESDIVVSCGVASINITTGEFGYLGKKGNSVLDNIGYGLGAVTNICDAYRFFSWDVFSYEQRYNKLEKWAAKNYGEKNMEYVSQFYDADKNPIAVNGTYNWETDKIRISNVSLSNDFGYAKSSYLHELNHRLDLTPIKKQLIVNKMMRSFEWDYKEAACAWHDQVYWNSDVKSYAFELNNASRYGLSFSEYNAALNLCSDYSQLSGLSVSIKNYTLWSFIKSVLLP